MTKISKLFFVPKGKANPPLLPFDLVSFRYSNLPNHGEKPEKKK